MELVISCNVWWIIFTFTSYIQIMLLPASHVEAQTLHFKATNASFDEIETAVVGQKIYLQCPTDMFDQTGVVEFELRSVLQRPQRRTVMRLENGIVTYPNTNQPESHYKTEIYQSTDSSGTVISLTINEINANDAGQYQCFIAPEFSNEVTISVQEFPRPACYAMNVVISQIEASFKICAEQGTSVTLGCDNDSKDISDIQVILEWTRGDGGDTSNNVFVGFKSASINATMQENGIIFTCTSKNSSYVGVTHSCSITMTVVPVGGTCFASTIYPPISSDVVASTISTSVLARTSSNIATQTSDTTYGSGTSSEPPVPYLVIGLGASTGFLVLVVIIIVAIVVYKRRSNVESNARRSSAAYLTPIENADNKFELSAYETNISSNPRYSTHFTAENTTSVASDSQVRVYDQVVETDPPQKTAGYVNSAQLKKRVDVHENLKQSPTNSNAELGVSDTALYSEAQS